MGEGKKMKGRLMGLSSAPQVEQRTETEVNWETDHQHSGS